MLSWISFIDVVRTLKELAKDEFQSLLSWISLFDHWAKTLLASMLHRFNPCCLGSVSSTFSYDDAILPPQRFQSLLSWISLFDHLLMLLNSQMSLGFNPCCLGSVSSTFFLAMRPKGAIGFQSLLSWISLFDPDLPGRRQPGRDVSILVVMDQSLRRSCVQGVFPI